MTGLTTIKGKTRIDTQSHIPHQQVLSESEWEADSEISGSKDTDYDTCLTDEEVLSNQVETENQWCLNSTELQPLISTDSESPEMAEPKLNEVTTGNQGSENEAELKDLSLRDLILKV